MAEAAVRHAILHGLLAAAFIEAVLRAWRIRSAQSRLAFWVLALAVPFLLVPAFLLAAPFRLDDHFAARAALFSTARWNAVRVAGRGAADGAFGLLALAATVLFLRDLVPFAREWWRERRAPAETLETPGRLRDALRTQAARVGACPASIEVRRSDSLLLFVRGFGRSSLVVSDALLTRLSDAELDAAVAHELAHVRFRDPMVGWMLMAARVAMFWNPAVQLVARAIVEETERRADAVAVRAVGLEPFETAFRRLSADVPRGTAGRLGSIRTRMHYEHVNARAVAWGSIDMCRPAGPARLAVVGATLALVLFFVV